MRPRPIASAPVLGAFLLALTLSILLAASMPIDDPYSTLNTQWNGTSALAEKGFLAVSADFTKTLLSTDGAAILLVFGPTRQFTGSETNFLADFVQKGGFLVLADNFGSGNSLLDLLGLPIRFSEKLLVDPLFYRKQPTFPAISDFSPSELSTGLDELVLDYATVLDIGDEGNVTVLAKSSPFSFLDIDKDGKRDAEEPSGPFPVLAKLELGRGMVVLFTSPASFANGLLREADNIVVVENIMNTAIVRQASQSEGPTVFLLDETHLEPSPFTLARTVSQRLFLSVWKGGMMLSEKLALTALAMMIVAIRYVYRKTSSEAMEEMPRSRSAGSFDVEQVLRLHPTWDRRKLEYVANELEASKWRRLREAE